MKILDILCQEVRSSATYNSNIQVAPAVILWPDAHRQWKGALPLLQAAMPELIVLGDYEPEKKQGPAIWIKCVIEGVLPEFQLPEGKTPIIYLPGYERRDLRAITNCPDTLKPLAELQYRGCWWIYNNSGRDWTVNAFLLSDNGGAGLDVARDENTQKALINVLPEILECDRGDLANRKLEASDFNKLLSSDPVRDLLTWMNEQKQVRERWDNKRWEALVGIWETEYHFNPEKDGVLTAAEYLCRKQGIWEGVWQRYVETCHHYPELHNLLLKVEPDLASDGSSYPAINEIEERNLETDLKTLLQDLDLDQLRSKLIELEAAHQERRQWIWHTLKLSPLAGVLEYLAPLAKYTEKAFSGTSIDEMGTQYRDIYWQVDDYFLKALAYPLKPQHQEIVRKLLGVMYQPWLEEVTINFQNIVRRNGYAGSLIVQEAIAPYQKSEVVFFVDGLRFDVAQRLIKRLHPIADVNLKHDWAALPSVTATAKAAVTPVQDCLIGRSTDKDFQPSLKTHNSAFSAHYLKKYLDEKGWQYLSESEVGDSQKNAWLQSGNIDNEGHAKGLKLAARIDSLLDEICDRIEDLLSAGWQRIRIVTDHGWILSPEPMPKEEIPKYLTETRWGRCALIKDSVQIDHLTVGWYWNPEVTVAMASGICNFTAGRHYDHGGLSLQECFTPVLKIINTKPLILTSPQKASIVEVRWVGLVCKIKVDTEDSGIVAVLRTQPANQESEISTRKVLKDGKCSLMVEDQYTETPAVVVLLDVQGNILAKQATIVGGDE